MMLKQVTAISYLVTPTLAGLIKSTSLSRVLCATTMLALVLYNTGYNLQIFQNCKSMKFCPSWPGYSAFIRRWPITSTEKPDRCGKSTNQREAPRICTHCTQDMLVVGWRVVGWWGGGGVGGEQRTAWQDGWPWKTGISYKRPLGYTVNFCLE